MAVQRLQFPPVILDSNPGTMRKLSEWLRQVYVAVDRNQTGVALLQDDDDSAFIRKDGTVAFTGPAETDSGRIVAIVRVTDDTTLTKANHHVFCDTDVKPITITLQAGVDGTQLIIANVGTSNRDVTIEPNGTDKILGENSNFTLNDGDKLKMSFEATEGWI